MTVLMTRTYLLLRKRIGPLCASLIAILALAGCGSSGGGAPAPAASVPPAASVAGGSGSFDAQLAEQVSHASSASAQSLASLSGGSSTPSSSATKATTKTAAAKTTSTHATASHTNSGVSTSSAAKTTPSKTTTLKTSKPASTQTVTKTVTTQAPAAPPRVVTKYRTIVKKVYVTKTQLQTKTVTQAPDVPAGAFMPSKHGALSATSFTVPGGSVGCVIGGGSVRCDVSSPTWNPPAQPSSCTSSWGNAIVLTNSTAARPAQFACGGTSALTASATTIKDGYDDTVGAITCQVRQFGVNCFAEDQQGFILSQTGYLLY